MKKYMIPALSIAFALSLLTGCSARKLDEKLDAEHSGMRTEVNGLVTQVDTMVAKMRFLASSHAEQDVKIDKAGLSTDDRKTQTNHKEWVKNYLARLDTIDIWTRESRERLAAQDSLEAAHNNVRTKIIRQDHETMLSELEGMRDEALTYRSDLLKADSVIHTFFYNHAYLNKKYHLVAEDIVKPPTTK